MRRALRFAIVLAAFAALAGCGRSETSSTPGAVRRLEWRQRSHAREAVEGADTSRIAIAFPEFTHAASPAVLDSLNAWVREAALHSFDGDTTAADTNAVMADFLGAWLEERRATGTVAAWFLDRSITVVGDTLGTVSLRWSEMTFTGGAHPNTTVTLAVFDAARGTLLEFGDVFRAAARDSFDAAVDPLFRSARGIAADADLAKLGLEFPDGRFRLNDNFSIGGKGLTFFYNAYEIAPYVMGPTELVVPWETARPYLRDAGR